MNKLKGVLVHNAGLMTDKFLEINEMYMSAAKEEGIELICIKNTDIKMVIDGGNVVCKFPHGIQDIGFILFLDKDIRLAKQLEKDGYKLYNSASTIENCDDKIRTAQVLANSGVNLPKTIFAPMIFNDTLPKEEEYYKSIEQDLNYPLVIKEAFGSFGNQVYLAKNRQELKQVHSKVINKPHLYQEFVSTSKGRDVRVQVVGNKVIASMLRVSKDDFRANVTNGGTMHSIDLPKSFEELALRAASIIGADFAGVDLLFGENNQPVLCEINSNAHIKNIYDCTGINVASCILQYIKGETYGY